MTARCGVVMRGDVYDGRNFVKSVVRRAARRPEAQAERPAISISTSGSARSPASTARRCAGSTSSCRGAAGQIRRFALNAKLGRDTPLIGDLRGARARPPGALFRDRRRRRAVPFHRQLSAHERRPDVGGDGSADARPGAAGRHPQYPRLLHPRRAGARPRGGAAQPASAAAASNSPACASNSPARPASSRSAKAWCAGRPSARRSTARSIIAKNEVRMRGTFVPLYGLNNAFGQMPIVGLFLGGSNEGLLGITYEVVGPPSAPTLARQSDLGGGAGPAAQILRVPERAPQRTAAAAPESGATRFAQ